MTNEIQTRISPSAQSTTTTSTATENHYEACPECGASRVAEDDEGIDYCEECGLLLSDVPIERTEPGWRDFKQRRLGPASSVSHEHVGTVIGSGGPAEETHKLTRYNNRLDHRTKALKDGLREIRSLCARLELPETTEEHAAYHYRQALQAQLLQGRSQESIAGACVYIGARRYHQPVTLANVAAVSPVEKSAISGAYRVLLQELNVKLRPPEPDDFLPKVAAKAGLTYQVERRACTLLERAMEDQQHVGQNPVGVAAAALYGATQALDAKVTQTDLAAAAEISAVTLSRQWQSISEYVSDEATPGSE